ncbi:MAG: isochorismatase hydrolase [Pelosinus sp.]|jgi:nicotinamidase-related amidase|nr:isochorismatase hydrolase [Pelosinus sp.]
MRLEKENSQFLLVDVQEKLFPYIVGNEIVAKKAILLMEGMKALEIPMTAAQQYPKGLGNTIEELRPFFTKFHDKMTFSCCGNEMLVKELHEQDRKNIIIAGIEAHICVLQTVIDLKALGFQPIVVVDAVGSRTRSDYEIALERMKYEGAILTTVESILFELCFQAGSDAFRTISKLVK